MATLFTTDCSDLGDWDQVSSGNIFVGAGGFQGDGIGSNIAPYFVPWLCKRISPNPSNKLTFSWYQYIPAGSIPFASASFYIVGALYYTGGSSFDFTNRQISFNTTQNGGLFLARGSYNGTVIATSASPMWIAGQWNFEEVTIVVDNTSGSILWKSNGVTLINQTGLDTQALGVAQIDGIEIVPQSIAGPSDSLIDNVVLEDDIPDDDGGSQTIPCCCTDSSGPAGGDTGEIPDPVGELPPWESTCTGGGLVDGVSDLTDGEAWT